MKPDEPRAAVVVGVDDAGSAGDAVDWAAAEAATRGCPLRIVHAIHPLLPADPYGVGSPIESLVMAGTAAGSVLQDFAARARCVASDLDVTTRLMCGAATWALLDEASRARLLVTGSRGLRGLRALLARSVSVQVAARASCPVVVVRPRRAEDRSGAPPRVVVGVHCDSACSPAIGFAFQAARQRGVALVAVHAWDPDPPADLEAAHGPPALAEAAARRTLERALQRWHARYPDVPVATRLVRGDPARAVVAESRGAALVVVGSRGRGRLTATVRGSVSQAVLRDGRGPIAVVHHSPDHSSSRRARYRFRAATRH